MSFIETQRLLVRAWMPSDLAAAYAVFGDAEVMRGVGSGAAWSQAETAAALARTSEDYEREGIGVWPVVHKASGAVVGACGLQPLPVIPGETELVCIFARRLWGDGYGFEAADAIVAWGFGERHLTRVVCLVDRENARAVAFVHRLGMRFERIVRAYRSDAMLYTRAPVAIASR